MEGPESQEITVHVPAEAVSGSYKFWRAVVRLWVALTLRKIRVLHEERLGGPEPALLVVGHPESFLDALILVAGFDRVVRCLIPAGLIKGPIQHLLARGLGMISFRPEKRQEALDICFNLLAEGAALATFVDPSQAQGAGGNGLAFAAASMAVAAERRQVNGLGLGVFPVHLFLPVGHIHSRELLIDVDRPEFVQEYMSHSGEYGPDEVKELAHKLEQTCQENSFRLQPADLKDFLDDLEHALRENLQEELESHPERKQKLDGFELSGFAVEWAEQMNYLHPGLLVSLREALETWCEGRRRGALCRLEVEGVGNWWGGRLGRGVVLLESVVGFAPALYGLVNHLVAAGLLFVTGLLKKDSGRDKLMEWLGRGLVVLVCYVLQIFLVGHFWGRRAAGYYAPSLPISALYLWRYAWLMRHQARIAYLSFSRSPGVARTARLRKAFVHAINQALEQHAEMLGLPH